MAEIGVGVTVCQEIKRDPDVADLVFSMFTATYGSPFMTPAPPFEYSRDVFEDIFLHLPPMRKIANECNNDQEVASMMCTSVGDVVGIFAAGSQQVRSKHLTP